MTNWQNHIRGLSTLMAMRNLTTLGTQEGRELFAQLRPLILINSLWDHTLIPEYWINHLHYSDAHHDERQKHVNALAWICIDVSNLRAKIRNRVISDPLEILRQVSWLDSQMEQWEMKSWADPMWAPTEVHDQNADPNSVWNGTCKSDILTFCAALCSLTFIA